MPIKSLIELLDGGYSTQPGDDQSNDLDDSMFNTPRNTRSGRNYPDEGGRYLSEHLLWDDSVHYEADLSGWHGTFIRICWKIVYLHALLRTVFQGAKQRSYKFLILP